MSRPPPCHATLDRNGGRGQRLTLDNGLVSATVLVSRGADIHEFVHRRSGIDVLYKSPWGVGDGADHLPAVAAETAWVDRYAGGWQLLLPNGGAACSHAGADLPFHGEAAWRAWDCVVTESEGPCASALLTVRLRRLPMTVERVVRIEAGKPSLFVEETVTNVGSVDIDFMWGHHPAFGPPLLGAGCRIDTGATSFLVDDAAGPGWTLRPGIRYSWPPARSARSGDDLARVQGADETGSLLGYLGDFRDGWFALTNAELGIGVGFAWPAETFPYAWMFQEVNSVAGYPWFGAGYVLAIEPNTSYPGRGLARVVDETRTHRTLAPGESASARLVAVIYEGRSRVAGIRPDASVLFVGEPDR